MFFLLRPGQEQTWIVLYISLEGAGKVKSLIGFQFQLFKPKVWTMLQWNSSYWVSNWFIPFLKKAKL